MIKLLSKTELEYLEGRKQVTNNYARYLKHTISKKLERFEQTIPTLITNQETRAWLIKLCNTVREYPNTVSQNPNTQNNISVNPLIDAIASHKGLRGASGGTRSRDPLLTRQLSVFTCAFSLLICRLSYRGLNVKI